MSSLQTRMAAVAALILGAVLALLPVHPGLREKLPEWWKDKYPRLGLDLQGGTHLVLRVETDKAIENRLDRLSTEVETRLKEEGVSAASVQRVGHEGLKLTGVGGDAEQKLSELLETDFPSLKPGSLVGGEVEAKLDEPEAKRIRDYSVDQGLETIRNRIDQLGLTEPVVLREGAERIVVQLPGLDDPDRAMRIIGKTAQLEFKVVARDQTALSASIEDPAKVPAGLELLWERRRDPITGQNLKPVPMLVEKKVLMTGEALANAEVRIGSSYNMPVVGLEFTPEGGRLFDEVASKIVGRQLAVILDGTIYSAPNIKQASYGGSAVIEGSFSDSEARDLALVLRAGALPAPVEILEKRAVGATLGQDSIRDSARAMAIGAAVVVLFMVVYYKWSGVVANLALILNLLLILGTMALLQATLTLPGIAGLVLNVGMAVDGNILVYERIREELRTGKTGRAAVDAGFDRAFLTIMDAQITTLIAAIMLFQFGTGPIKGFAVTLSVGTVWTVITVVFVSRVIFDYYFQSRRAQRVSV